jgi:hypothetical protein
VADPIAFGVLDADGNPLTTAAPAFLLYVERDGTSRAPPPVVHLGLGRYAFEPTAADEAVGVCFLLDGGAGARINGAGRYLAGTVPEAAAFECWVLTDGGGNLWTGAAPTFPSGGYEDRHGNALTPPAISSLGLGVYAFTPSASDIAAGVNYRVDSPPGALPAYLFGSATAPTVGPYSAPASGTYPADAVAQMLAGSIALPHPPGGGPVVLTYGADGNLLVGPVRPVSEGVETLAVFVLQSGGVAPQPYMGQAESWHVSSVQVVVRSPVEAFQQGEALARALHARAHLNTPPGYTFCLAAETDPVYLGTTDAGSHLHAFNLAVGHRR